jgi:hypothetical protein
MSDNTHRREYFRKKNKEWNIAHPGAAYERCKQWRRKNREKVRAINRDSARRNAPRRKKKYREFINAVKLANGCQNPDCQWVGDFLPSCLDFHHINKDEKSFSIGSKNCSIPLLSEEMKKCCVLCANCHRQIRWGELDSSTLPYCRIPD